MCGIVGVIRSDNKVDSLLVTKMRDVLRHRGPDDAGIYVSPHGRVAMGHRRLSIIDLSQAGHQPMCNEDGNLWLVYNGEIYNFGEIRVELQNLGHIFRSKTDSEVIIHGYEEWGEKVLNRFRGMFAFAIWDECAETLFCARDRFGIKPFFYYIDSEKFIFASELKSILVDPTVDRSIEETAIYDFFTYLYIPTPKTILKSAFKLPPGHWLRWHKGRYAIKQYWDIDFAPKLTLSEEEAEEELSKRLKECVRMRLVSDVPVGVLLSGGLDSSAVAAYANGAVPNRLRTFSMGFKDSPKDETLYSRFMARTLNSDHTEQILEKDGASTLGDYIIKIYGEPYADSSAIPTYLVSQMARKSVKVALSGDGGDEVFGGYRWYSKFIPFYMSRNKPFISVVRRAARLINSVYPYWKGKHRIGTYAADEWEYYTMLMGGTTRNQKEVLFSRSFLDKFRDYDDYWFFRKFWKIEYDIMSRLQYLDMKTYLPEDILTKVDIASMAVSLEVRVPLLDHTLVEFVASLPWVIRNRDFERKYLFKKVISHILPDEIMNKSKQGFSVPLEEYFNIEDVPKEYNSFLHTILDVKKRVVSKNPTQIWQLMSLYGTVKNIIGI